MNFIRNYAHWVLGLLALTLIGLQACSSNSVTPGKPTQITSTGPTYTPTPCSGIFGSTTIDSTVGTTFGSSVFLYPVQTTQNKDLISLAMYSNSSIPVTYEMGVYADNAGAPSTLLGQTGQQISAPVTGWNTVTLSPSIPITASVNYWLAYHSTNILYQAAAAVTYAYQNGVTVYGSLPGTFAGTVSANYIISLHGTTCP